MNAVRDLRLKDQMLPRANLVGRRLRVDLKYKAGNDGKEYADVTPLRTRPAAAPAEPPAPEDELDPNAVPF